MLRSGDVAMLVAVLIEPRRLAGLVVVLVAVLVAGELPGLAPGLVSGECTCSVYSSTW
jgi:hypothetical protein